MQYKIEIPIKATLLGTTKFTKLRRNIRIAINEIEGINVEGQIKIYEKEKIKQGDF